MLNLGNIRRRLQRPEGGYTLAELMTVIVIMGVVAGIIVGLVVWANRTFINQDTGSRAWATVQDANIQLQRDINDSSRVMHADANSVSVLVVRDERCEQRTWAADPAAGTLTVTTRQFQTAACSGGSTEGSQTIIGRGTGQFDAQFVSDPTFRFFETATSDAMEGDIEPDRVRRVEWTLAAQPDRNSQPRTLMSAATVTPRHIQFGGGEQGNPEAPSLFRALRAGDVSTASAQNCHLPATAGAAGRTEGRDRPILFWCDPTPDLTLGWSVWRLANPEGMSTDDPARTTWTRIATITDTHFTDTTLPDGYTAQYVVRALVATGLGPTSNQVITGMRPAANTMTATGVGNRIDLEWTVPTGTTGFDIFRFDAADGRTAAPNGHLIARISDANVTTFSDGSEAQFPDVAVGDVNAGFRRDSWPGTHTVAGYGHTHNYVVVPTNRWEDVARGQAGQNRPSERANLGSTLANWRNASPRVGAFTAPAAPTLNSAASPTASGSTRATTLNWTPAGWNGSGPAAHATRWHPVYRMSNHSTDQAMPVVNAGANPTAAVTTVHAAAGMQPGRWYDYAVSGENAAGRGPQSNMNVANGNRTWVRNWQRPANPAASATPATGTGSLPVPHNTRAIDVRGSLNATADESYAANRFTMQQSTRGGNDASPTGWQTQLATGVFRFDRINHNSTRQFQVRVQGNGGFSDVVTTSGSTALLAAGQPTITATTTRRIAATFNATNGNTRQLILEGGHIHSGNRTINGTSADWTAIGDGRAYTVRSRNTDGHNTVQSTRAVSTPTVHIGIEGRHGTQPTRSLCLRAWSNNANPTDVHINGVRVGTSDGCHNSLAHNTTFGMVGTASDGVNVRQASGAGSTHLLNVSVSSWAGGTPTRSICASGGSSNGWISAVHIAGASVGNNGCHNNLTHGTGFTITATATDGHNSRSASTGRSTAVLAAPATPTCNASASPNSWVGATVFFTSNGSLSRSSVRATSTGWWSATATASRTDGWNTVTRQNSCGVQITQRPWVSVGRPPGAASPACDPFRSDPLVVSGLSQVAGIGSQNLSGAFVAEWINGSRADRGTDAHGSAAALNLSCNFVRAHRIRDTLWNTEFGQFNAWISWWIGNGFAGGGQWSP